MIRPSDFKAPCIRWWLLPAIMVLTLGQALASWHVHGDSIDNNDCYICQHGDDQGKKLTLAAPNYLAQLQRVCSVAISQTASIRRPLSAAAIRAPPIPRQF